MKLFENLEKAFLYIGVGCLVAMWFFMLAEVSRNFGVPGFFRDSYALVGLMMIGVTYMGLSYVEKGDGHIKMRLLMSKMQENKAVILRLIYNLIEIAVLLFIIRHTIYGTVHAYEIMDTTIDPGAYVNWPIRALVPLGLGLYVIRLMIQTVQELMGFIKKHQNSEET